MTALLNNKMKSKQVLYISYDGMTDNLGQSQVIPYLKGLSEKGYLFTLMSFEKAENYLKNKDKIAKLLSDAGIVWHPLSYTAKPPVFSTVKDIRRLVKTAKKLHLKEHFSIVHCRSYISAFAGLYLKRKYGVKFVFDMRGFWPDERVEGKVWSLNNPIFKIVYSFFKRQELNYFREADYTISLTEAGKNEIHRWKQLEQNPIPIEVIPCCADFEHFKPSNAQKDETQKLKKRLGIQNDDFVLSYLGSVGTWYMLDEMLDFYKALVKSKPNARFLFITGEPKQMILDAAIKHSIPTNNFIIESSPREMVPAYIALSTVSLFFIIPTFSKKASSPTKMAEIMGMGIPLICNDKVGDVGTIINESKAGVAIQKFDDEAYDAAILKIDDLLNLDPEKIRAEALKRFSLKGGVESYEKVYKMVLKD